MRKLRTLENTRPTDVRTFKKSLKHVDKFTKESVDETLTAIQHIVESSLEDANECTLEFQYSIQRKIAEMSIDSSNGGFEAAITEQDINKLLMPLALKLQHLHEDYLFAEIDHYMPIRVINGQGPLGPELDPKMDHEILLNWLETFNTLIERARHELKHL